MTAPAQKTIGGFNLAELKDIRAILEDNMAAYSNHIHSNIMEDKYEKAKELAVVLESKLQIFKTLNRNIYQLAGKYE